MIDRATYGPVDAAGMRLALRRFRRLERRFGIREVRVTTTAKAFLYVIVSAKQSPRDPFYYLGRRFGHPSGRPYFGSCTDSRYVPWKCRGVVRFVIETFRKPRLRVQQREEHWLQRAGVGPNRRNPQFFNGTAIAGADFPSRHAKEHWASQTPAQTRRRMERHRASMARGGWAKWRKSFRAGRASKPLMSW